MTDLSQIVERVQEAQMFTDRRTDELHHSVLELADRLAAVERRLDRIESRIGSLDDLLQNMTEGDDSDPSESTAPGG